MDYVILVDGKDNPVGKEEKLEAHRQGKLHRAFSIFVFNSKGEVMMQKRHRNKYHSGGLWTNTCCSHPRPDESVLQAAHRRLKEEMGFDCELKEAFSFVYEVKLDKGLIEHEFDHVIIGKFDGAPKVNAEEAEDWNWMKIDELHRDVKANPQNYTRWLQIAIDRVVSHISSAVKSNSS
ncbi:MAG: isopentenyl-diphosphate Delta-isomerase [Nanoarchaeota archaeon]